MHAKANIHARCPAYQNFVATATTTARVGLGSIQAVRLMTATPFCNERGCVGSYMIAYTIESSFDCVCGMRVHLVMTSIHKPLQQRLPVAAL